MIDSVAPKHRRLWSGLTTDAADAPIGILGIPFDGATSFRKGAASAPQKIRSLAPHVDRVTEDGVLLDGLSVRDYGDVAHDLDWARYFASVQHHALATLQHPFALFLGGDHSVTIPLHAAFKQHLDDTFGVIQLDSHTDLMPVYEGHKWSHACTARRALDDLQVNPAHYAFVGIRSWVADELDYVAAHPKLGIYSARSIYQRGIETIAQEVVTQMQGVAHIYLTLDIDCLDPAYAPGTGTPEAGGLTTRELLEFLRIIFAALPVRAMDIVEVAPPLDYSDITSIAALKVIYEVFGWKLTARS